MSEDKGDRRLRAENLELWRGDKCLFRDLSFAVKSGEMLLVSGPNGCGKTSLLRVLCGLTLPENGSLSWGGRRMRGLQPEFRRDLAYLAHSEGLKGDLTPLENLVFDRGLRAEVNRDRIVAIVDQLGLSHAANLPVRVLSAGQKRRTALARVLMCDAPLWVLDEPFTNLDVAGRSLTTHLIESHLSDGGMAIVAAHHGFELPTERIRTLELGA